MAGALLPVEPDLNMGSVNGARQLPPQQNVNAEPWATYPRNLAPMFDGEDLDIYNDFFADNTARLFRGDIFRVGLWTVQNTLDKAANGTNGQLEQAANDENDQLNQAANGETDQLDQAANGDKGRRVKRRLLVKHEVNDQASFDAQFKNHVEPNEDHFILLFQLLTWSALSNTEEAMRKILSTHSVHPGYLDFLSSFGTKQDESQEDMFGGYSSRFWTDVVGHSGFEMYYNLRYVEKTKREQNPWSVRRLGVYQKHNTTTKASIWIFIQPTTAAERLIETFGSSKDLLHLALHISLISSTVGNWRNYLKDLDNVIREKGKAARFFQSDNFDQRHTDFPLAFEAVQRLQYPRQCLEDAVLILDTNLEILAGIQAMLKGLSDRKVEPDEEKKRSLEESLYLCISRITMHRKWAAHSLSRAQSISDLFHALLGYRNDASVKQSSESLATMATESAAGSRTMLALTNATKRDSGIMRVIAVITMVYLPGTFMATLFSTVFVNLASASTPDFPTARKEAGIYAGVTILLMIVTGGFGYLLDDKEKKRQEAAQDPAPP